ncbi:hypothetical protein IV203_037398 [Nitzschia inconspicua]|uniref:Uncharacterized protein n=1 Tax=Nitzschia inconspicua TaxID=303405 RepID=A0A9K3PYI8_9STRA|nr:hypothetical protein IV203_037398 [Nitzschia inconspicua]
MSTPTPATPTSSAAAANPNAGKKAVHVKWAGKTIALGTFPSSEADEKCARAKALTRAWRSTMRPKPTREWVMTELERLGVRVVSGRLGRKAGEDDEGEIQGGPTVDRKSSMGWGSGADLDTLMQQRRSSSLGLSMLNDDINRRSSLGSLGPALGFDSGHLGEPSMPPHRPLVGGGAAAAYEAARADHYAQKREEQQRRASSLGLGIGGGGGMPNMGLSVNPNQHYEMLKLHHMNLLNEIQETTLMMNLYQQQQLQQQQQQLQQQQQASEGSDQMSMLLQQGGSVMDVMFGGGPMSSRGSLGMGVLPSSQPMIQQQPSSPARAKESFSASNAAADKNPPATSKKEAEEESENEEDEIEKKVQQQKMLEEQLKKLQEEIEQTKKQAAELKSAKSGTKEDGSVNGEKRKADKEPKDDNEAKKAKTDDSAKEEKTDEKDSEEK